MAIRWVQRVMASETKTGTSRPEIGKKDRPVVGVLNAQKADPELCRALLESPG
jgi:hypothetical protein